MSDDGAEEGHCCPICLDALEGDEHVLECGHAFHAGCLIGWLRQGQPTCPSCRGTSLATQIDTYSVRERARHLRRTACRRRDAPAELTRRLHKLRAAEALERTALAAIKECKREHAHVFRRVARLTNRRWAARMRVCDAERLLGIFASHALPLPTLAVPPPSP